MEKDLDTIFAECYSNLQRSQKGLFFYARKPQEAERSHREAVKSEELPITGV